MRRKWMCAIRSPIRPSMLASTFLVYQSAGSREECRRKKSNFRFFGRSRLRRAGCFSRAGKSRDPAGKSLRREQARRRALFSYYHQAFGLPYIALRYANIYGPRQSTKGEAGVVAIFLSLLLSGKTPVINGDGGQTRDYVYVGDVVAANVAALESSFVGPINIGTGVETDVVAIFQHLRAAVGSQIQARHGPTKTGEQRRSCLDARHAGQVLGWRPQMVLAEGLRRTAEHYRATVGR